MAAENLVVGIDPGLRGCGVAILINRTVVAAKYVKNECREERGPKAWVSMASAVSSFVDAHLAHNKGPLALVQEVMKVYPKQKGDAADLLELNGVNGAIAALVPANTYQAYFARDWKGQVPKEIHNSRIEAKLQTAEAAVIDSIQSLRHNVLDAIGIGFYYVGR